MNAPICWAHRDGLPVTLGPLGGEHVLAGVRHLKTYHAAHAPLAEALVGPRLSIEPPFAVPQRPAPQHVHRL